MLNNEIRRLVRCIVEASAESNIQFEEIQAEITKQFGKEILTQVYQDADPKDFREKAKLFCKNEMGYKESDRLEQTTELLCIFHELRCKTPKEDMVSGKMIREMFIERSNLKESTAIGRCRSIATSLKWYLEKKNGIKTKYYERTEKILEEVYPFIVRM